MESFVMTRVYSYLIRLVIACCMATASMSVPLFTSAAMAQERTTQLEQLLEQAIDDYEMLMIEDAEQALLDAIAIARQHNLSGPVLARVYIMLGIVHQAIEPGTTKTEEAFIKALQNDPQASIERVYQTPVLNQAFEQAKNKARPTPPVVESPIQDVSPFATAQPTPPDDPTELVHTPIRRATAGTPLLFEVTVPASMPVDRVILHHRRFGESGFTALEMTPTSATRYTVSLGASHVRSSQLDYYIEAVDRSGSSLASSGKVFKPHNVAVLGSQATASPITKDEQWRDSGAGWDEPSESKLGFYLLLGGGTDIGFLAGGIPTANRHRQIAPGIVPAFGHGLLDLGLSFSESAHLGLYFRWQFSPAQNFELIPTDSKDPGSGFWDSREECFGWGLPGDCMLGLKYRWVFSTGKPAFYSSLGGGIGRMRNWLQLKHTTTADREIGLCTDKEIHNDPAIGDYCYIRDTVRTGWAHLGLGTGMYYPLTSFLDLAADAYLMVLVPEVSINLDVTLGLRLRL